MTCTICLCCKTEDYKCRECKGTGRLEGTFWEPSETCMACSGRGIFEICLGGCAVSFASVFAHPKK